MFVSDCCGDPSAHHSLQSMLTKFEIWLLRRIFFKRFRQGHQHNVGRVYGIIREVFDVIYIEDSFTTKSEYLFEEFMAELVGTDFRR